MNCKLPETGFLSQNGDNPLKSAVNSCRKDLKKVLFLLNKPFQLFSQFLHPFSSWFLNAVKILNAAGKRYILVHNEFGNLRTCKINQPRCRINSKGCSDNHKNICVVHQPARFHNQGNRFFKPDNMGSQLPAVRSLVSKLNIIMDGVDDRFIQLAAHLENFTMQM